MFMLVQQCKMVCEFIELVVCLWSSGLGHFLSRVIFCWYLRCPHMSLHPVDYASGLHNVYFIPSALVVIHFMPNYSSMYPWSSIFSLYYIWSCREKKNIFWVSTSSLVCSFPFINAECLLPLWLHIKVDLLNLGSIHLDGLLNKSMTGLGSLRLNSVIYNKYIHTYIIITFIALFMVFFTNFMNASACTLLWWLYGDDTVNCQVTSGGFFEFLWQHA